MVTFEQVKLLESKVAKAIDFVNRVTGENSLLKGKLETCLKRIDELEVLVRRFQEDQGRIEAGILAALNRLNEFEDAIGNSPAAQNSVFQEEKSLDVEGEAPEIKGPEGKAGDDGQLDGETAVGLEPEEGLAGEGTEEGLPPAELDIF